MTLVSTDHFFNTAISFQGQGLLTSNGLKWGRQRKLLTGAFHFDVLKSYMGVYSECTSIFMVGFDHIFFVSLLQRTILIGSSHCQTE